MTLQTMVFEPKPLLLHLSVGACPASSHALKKIDLSRVLTKSVTP
jgi:hypothetical protein